MKLKQRLFSGKRFFLLGFAAMFLAAAFILTACKTDDNDSSASITGVTITPAARSVDKGKTLLFTATVAGDSANAVTWSLDTTDVASGTSIGERTGLLTVAADENKTSLQVRATSTADPIQSGTATVDITSGIIDVTVVSASDIMDKGGTMRFTATVNGDVTNAVTWSIITPGSVPGTGISNDETQPNVGLLTVSRNETRPLIEVKATSTADSNKSGSKGGIVNVDIKLSDIEDDMVRIPSNPLINMASFVMLSHEVTRGDYKAVTGRDYTAGLEDYPVANITWEEAVQFCNELTDMSTTLYLTKAYRKDETTGVWTWDVTATGYRLPTEDEWEYACRAGSTDKYCIGNTVTVSKTENGNSVTVTAGWYNGNSGMSPHQVKQMPGVIGTDGKVISTSPNAWGLYDMHGNVAEWCWTLFDSGAYNGGMRAVRGGAYNSTAEEIESSKRSSEYESNPSPGIGFRVVRGAK
jgi:hypothetical protein